MTEDNNAYYRRIAHALGDLLKQPENDDLRQALLEYDVKEHGAGLFTYPLSEGRPFLELYCKIRGIPVIQTPLDEAQTARWNTLIEQVHFQEAAGSEYNYVFLLTQAYLGKTEVIGW